MWRGVPGDALRSPQMLWPTSHYDGKGIAPFAPDLNHGVQIPCRANSLYPSSVQSIPPTLHKSHGL